MKENGIVQSTAISAQTDFIEVVGNRIGRYRLLEEIGEGAFGMVWMAEQVEPVRRKVALKIIKLGMDTRNVVARFEAERQALAMMDHPNIAQVFDGGATESGRPYFVMELVRGVPLTQFCDAQKLNTRERIALFINVCEAVHHAHQRGIIHRDLKPTNILVTEQDGRPLPKVIDFGIAKATGQQLTDKTLFTHFNQFMGTPAYMSPEQTGLGLDIDTRSDVYSLGVLLYELVAGNTPFDAPKLMKEGADAMQRTIREVEPPKPSTRFSTLRQEELLKVAALRHEPPTQLGKQLRGDLDWIALKTLEKDRNRRYGSARELAEDLRHFLADEPISAGPPSVRNRFAKAWRRNRLLYGSMFAVAFALVAGLTVSTWMAVRESRSSRIARSTSIQLRSNLYASEMGNAFRAWREGRVFQARTLLEKQIPEPRSGVPDLRGFDWRYLWAQTRPAEMVSIPNAACWGLAVTADGRTFAGRGLLDQVMRLWDLEGRREMAALTNVTLVFSASFSPDGSRLAFSDSPWSFTNAVVEIWNVSARTLERSIPLKYAGLGLTFSRDGKLLLSSGGLMYNPNSRGEVRLWDSTSGRELFASEEIPSWAFQCAFSPDDRFFAVSCGDGVVRIWDVSSKSLAGELAGHNGFTAAVAFTPDGNRLAIGDEGGYCWIWRWREQRPERVIKAHDGPLYSIVFTSDETRMVTASRDYTAKLWDTSTARELNRFTGHQGGVTAAHVMPDDNTVLTASQDGVAKLWSLKAEHSGNVIATNRESAGILFAARGKYLARIERGIKRLTIFDAETRAELKTIEATEIASSPDGTVLVAVRGSELIFLNPESLVETGRLDCRKVLGGKPSISPDNKWLALRGADRAGDLAETDVLIVDLPNRKTERLLDTDDERWAPVYFALNGKTLITLQSHTHRALLWDTTTWTPPSTLFNPRRPTGALVADVSADGMNFACIGEDNTLLLWNLKSFGAPARIKAGIGEVNAIAFDHDGKTVALAAISGAIHIWNLQAGQEIFALTGHDSYAASLAFSPDGTGLASAGFDRTLRMWRTPAWEQINR